MRKYVKLTMTGDCIGVHYADPGAILDVQPNMPGSVVTFSGLLGSRCYKETPEEIYELIKQANQKETA